MKFKITFLVVVYALVILGGGCKISQQKMTQEDIRKSSSSSMMPQAGPFNNIRFIFYQHPENKHINSMNSFDGEKNEMIFKVGNENSLVSSSTKFFVEVVAKQKSVDKVLSEVISSSTRIVYSRKHEGKVIDEVRCFDREPYYCERYLAIDQNRSLIITDSTTPKFSDAKSIPFYALVDFEFVSQEPVGGEWVLVDNHKELPFTFSYPKSINKLTIKADPSVGSIEIYNGHASGSMRTSSDPSEVEIKVVKESAKKLIADRRMISSDNTLFEREEVVNGTPVISLCSRLPNSKRCVYYFSHLGQDTIQVTEYDDYKVYKTLQFKKFYPYDPLEILKST